MRKFIQTNWKFLACLFVLFVLMTQQAEAQITIQLVSARDHIEGSFVGNQSVYADKTRIYLASFQGKLFVLARDRSANFPLLQIIQDTSFPLTAVRGDKKHLYVISADGNLRIYRKQDPLLLINTVHLASFRLSSLALRDGKLYVALGQAQLAVNGEHIFLEALNSGDTALEIDKKMLMVGLTYGETFEPNTVVVFDRENGDRVGGIAADGLNLFADGRVLVQTPPGCCGAGIFIYDPDTFELEETIPRQFTNTVVRRGHWLIAGNEAGLVDVFDLNRQPSLLVSTINLPQLTGHLGPEDIEIRALWTDSTDKLIFGGSSWGNEASRGPKLPSFFVLELVKN